MGCAKGGQALSSGKVIANTVYTGHYGPGGRYLTTSTFGSTRSVLDSQTVITSTVPSATMPPSSDKAIQPNSSNYKVALGVGLGLGLPAALILAAVGFYLFSKARKKKSRPYEVKAESQQDEPTLHLQGMSATG